MATLNVEINFDSDLEYTWTYSFGGGDPPDPTALQWASGEGDPDTGAALVQWPNGVATGSRALWRVSQTFEDWGVPVGATIDTVGNVSFNGKSEGTANAGSTIEVGLQNQSYSYVVGPYALNVEDATAWANYTNAATAAPGVYDSSTDTFRVVLRSFADTDNGPSNYGDFYWDTITFDIEYTADPDVDVATNTDALVLVTYPALIQQGAATNVLAIVDELALTTYPAGIVFDVVVNTTTAALSLVTYRIGGPVDVATNTDELVLVTYPASLVIDVDVITNVDALILAGQHAAIIYRLTATAAAPAPTRDIYTSTIAGISLGMTQFNVTRTAALEEATVYLPAAIESLVDVADALVVARESYTAGNPTPVTDTLYSGTVTTREQNGSELQVFSNQAPSYPARVERTMDRISYEAGGTSTTLRGAINSAFVPGDDVVYGTASRFSVARVVFYASGNQAAMELSSG